jgi:ethanolamine utilization microcompartment shell protein EutL
MISSGVLIVTNPLIILYLIKAVVKTADVELATF